MTLMSISTSLRRAAKLQEKIEELRGQLVELLDKARAELDVDSSEDVPAPVRRSGRSRTLKPTNGSKVGRGSYPPQNRKVDGRSELVRAQQVKSRSPLAGHKRASSPSGPLAPAVVKILEQKKQPMNVRDILAQLLATGYTFNAPEPRKNLAARIYRLKGVKQVSAGLFAKA